MSSDHYRTLGLQRNASKSDIKNAYFRLAQRYHPDHHARADVAGRAAAAAWFRKVKDAYEVLHDDRRRAEYDRTIRSSSWSSSASDANRQQHGQSGGSGSSASSSSSGHGNRQQQGPHGGDTSESAADSEWIWERARARGQAAGGAHSTSSSHGNRQGQYGGTSSSSGGGGSASSAESDTEWLWERARARAHGGGASSTSGNRPPPRVPRPMAALFLCCAGVLGGSALLWSRYYKSSARKQES